MVPYPRSAKETEGLTEWEIRGLQRGLSMADTGVAYAEIQGTSLTISQYIAIKTVFYYGYTGTVPFVSYAIVMLER